MRPAAALLVAALAVAAVAVVRAVPTVSEINFVGQLDYTQGLLGEQVAWDTDGELVAVSSRTFANAGVVSGAVNIFLCNAEGATGPANSLVPGCSLVHTLLSPYGENSQFGRSLAFAQGFLYVGADDLGGTPTPAPGSVGAVGVFDCRDVQAGNGCLHVFTVRNPSTSDPNTVFGAKIAVDGYTLAVSLGAVTTDEVAICVFDCAALMSNDTCVVDSVLTAADFGAGAVLAGLDLQAGSVFIGLAYSAVPSGLVVVWQLGHPTLCAAGSPNVCTPLQTINSGSSFLLSFGAAVVYDKNVLVITAPLASYGADVTGAVLFYTWDCPAGLAANCTNPGTNVLTSIGGPNSLTGASADLVVTPTGNGSSFTVTVLAGAPGYDIATIYMCTTDITTIFVCDGTDNYFGNDIQGGAGSIDFSASVALEPVLARYGFVGAPDATTPEQSRIFLIYNAPAPALPATVYTDPYVPRRGEEPTGPVEVAVGPLKDCRIAINNGEYLQTGYTVTLPGQDSTQACCRTRGVFTAETGECTVTRCSSITPLVTSAAFFNGSQCYPTAECFMLPQVASEFIEQTLLVGGDVITQFDAETTQLAAVFSTPSRAVHAAPTGKSIAPAYVAGVAVSEEQFRLFACLVKGLLSSGAEIFTCSVPLTCGLSFEDAAVFVYDESVGACFAQCIEFSA